MRVIKFSGVSRLGTILVVDLIIVALASGGYLFIQSLPKPQFELSDLLISIEEVEVSKPIVVSVKVRNVGELPGNYTVSLVVNQTLEEERVVLLEAEETKTIEFITAKTEIGAYNVDINGLKGSFIVRPPKPAEFEAFELTISRYEAGIDEAIVVSVKVRNVGELPGNYTVSLVVNQTLEEERVVLLEAEETKTIEFSTARNEPGIYFVNVDGLIDTFTIVPAPPPPKPATFEITDLIISYDEILPGEPTTISVKVRNVGELPGNYTVSLVVNQTLEGSETMYLEARRSTRVDFSVARVDLGVYMFTVDGLNGSFIVTNTPTPRHTLRVRAIDPRGFLITVKFWLNNSVYYTTFSQDLKEGVYTITTVQVSSIYTFAGWEDGSYNPTRTVGLMENLTLTASYVGRSCPSLYVWNGTSHVYVTEISDGTGYLGVVDYFQEDGTPIFSNQFYYPWDYIKINSDIIRPKDGYYEFIMTQRWDEIFYLDSATLLIVDHSPDVEVFSTEGEQYLDPAYMGKIYTVNKNSIIPTSCINGKGDDCLAQIAKLDGVYTEAHNYQYDTLELDLGDLSGVEDIKLLIAGATVWPSGKTHGEWCEKFVDQPGVPPFLHPYMEVKDVEGSWIRVPQNRQFPKVDVTPETFIVDLSGLFPTNDYSLRINVFWKTVFDYIAVDLTPQQEVSIQRVYPTNVDLYRVFETKSESQGNFTKYGEVTPLAQRTDDIYVIGRQGDEVCLRFPAELSAQSPTLERDIFLFANLWFKDGGLPFLNFTVNPLPFRNMTAFPYPESESYPQDTEHLNYLSEYNTRVVNLKPSANSWLWSSNVIGHKTVMVYEACCNFKHYRSSIKHCKV